MSDRDMTDSDSNATSSRVNVRVGGYRSLISRIRQSPMVQTKRPQSGGRLQLQDESLRLGLKMVPLQDGNIAFHRAAASGNSEEVRKVLAAKKYDLDALDEYGFTALHYAAQYNKVFIVNMLLDFGASVAVVGIDGSTPLHLAARFNSMDALLSLIGSGAKVNVANSVTGSTALHEAAAFGNKEIVEHLLKNVHADANASDFKAVTPLMHASGAGYSIICLLLLQYGAKIDIGSAEGMTALHFAATNGDSYVTQQIVEAAIRYYFKKEPSTVSKPESSPDFKQFINRCDLDGSTALHLAVQTGSKEVSQVLIEYGADVNCQNKSLQTPIYLAAVGGHQEVLKMLISKGGNVNETDSQQKSALHSAAALGSVRCIEILHENGAEIDARDQNGQTPFHQAVAAGQTDCAKLFISFGAKLSAQDKRLCCCIHLAVEHGREETLIMLLSETGSDLVNIPDHKQRTSLHYAARADNPKLLELLLATKVNGCVRDVKHKTPLHVAADRGTARQVKALTQAAPSCVWLRDDQRRTPLHYAVISMKRKSCVILLEMGADINSPDIVGWTPLLWAAKAGNLGVAELLLERGVITDHVDIDGNAALHVAAHFNQVETTRILMNYGASLQVLNKRGMTCLDVAMEAQNNEVVMVIVKHQRWREALTATSVKSNPMGRLIEHFPDAAHVVMDRCIQRSLSERSIKYDFTLLDPGPDDQSGAKGERFLGLSTMVKHKQQLLLTHALSRKLMVLKWRKFGWFVYGGNLFLYSIFIVFLTIFVLTERDTLSFPEPPEPGEKPEIEDDFFQERNSFNQVVPYIVITFAILHLVKELYQIYSQRFRYFTDWSNALEWTLYITALLFVLPYISDDTNLREEYDIYWQMGTFSIFFAYINLILIIEPLKYFGLYVTMFLEVMKTVFKVLCLFVMFTLAFSMAFFILLKEQDAFATIGKTLMKVTAMTTGEIEYSATVIDQLNKTVKVPGAGKRGIPLVPFEHSTYFFYYLFILVMPIALVNLLIGLAVGDIEAIQKTAFLRNKGKQITFIADIERKFPKFFTRRMYSGTEIVRVAVGGGNFWKRRTNKEEFQDEDLLGDTDEIDEMTLRLDSLTREIEKSRARQKIMMGTVDQQRDILLAVAERVGVEVNLPTRVKIE